jgi:hypothetical protein
LKKSFSIFLIISFLFNTTGSLLIFLVLQSNLKESAREKISSNDYNRLQTLIVFTNKDLRNGKADLKFFDEQEFSFRGKMYDIIKHENKNDSVYFYCFADTDEDDLNLAFTKKGNADEHDKNSANKNLLKNVLEDGVLTGPLFIPDYILERKFHGCKILKLSSETLEIPTPPPVLIPV